MVGQVNKLLRAAGNKVRKPARSRFDMIVERPDGETWGVFCFRHAPHARLTAKVQDHLDLIFRSSGVDRLVVFTMAEHLSPAADNLDPAGPIKIMDRGKVEELYTKALARKVDSV